MKYWMVVVVNDEAHFFGNLVRGLNNPCQIGEKTFVVYRDIGDRRSSPEWALWDDEQNYTEIDRDGINEDIWWLGHAHVTIKPYGE